VIDAATAIDITGIISRKRMPRLNKIGSTSLLITLLGLHFGSAQADQQLANGWFDSATVYAAQGADHNLTELPGKIVTADIAWDKSYFTAISAGKTRGTLGASMASLNDTPFGAISHGYEVILVKHRGLQSNLEASAAYMLRTPTAYLGPVGVSFGTGAGLSYAFGTPSYEDGPKNDPDRRYRLQLLALFELEWRLRDVDNVSLVTRVHHRSGVYGLIAPRNVGSNFLAAGIRFQF
jgi:hypothetical protein